MIHFNVCIDNSAIPATTSIKKQNQIKLFINVIIRNLGNIVEINTTGSKIKYVQKIHNTFVTVILLN